MTSGLSASGARIRGDDYQHLFTWLQALKMIGARSDITKIGIEDPTARNADDVTLYTGDVRCECYQIKSSVDASKTAGKEWFMKQSESGGLSMVQGFYRLWTNEQSGHKPTITLVTNRLPTPTDPLMRMLDGRDCTVARGLRHAGPKSQALTVRQDLARHLGVTEERVVEFFQDVRFMLGRSNDDLTSLAKDHMSAIGLRHDEDAVTRGVEIVRGWVTGGKRVITVAEMRREVESLKQPGNSPTASVLVQAIGRDPVPETATITLDWADLFPGNEPRVRCQPLDPAMWNGRFRPELQRAALDLRAQGHAYVLVKGYMRLPTWFVAGVELCETAGFQVSSFQGQEEWSSTGGLTNVVAEHTTTAVGIGQDLAVSVALATDPSEDVLTYLHERQISAGKYVCIRPKGGVCDRVIRNASEARGWAYEIRSSVRCFVQEYKSNKIHLFLAGPHGVVLLLGHLWNRMPSTYLYEDLGSGRGYSPSYFIPG